MAELSAAAEAVYAPCVVNNVVNSKIGIVDF